MLTTGYIPIIGTSLLIRSEFPSFEADSSDYIQPGLHDRLQVLMFNNETLLFCKPCYKIGSKKLAPLFHPSRSLTKTMNHLHTCIEWFSTKTKVQCNCLKLLLTLSKISLYQVHEINALQFLIGLLCCLCPL